MLFYKKSTDNRRACKITQHAKDLFVQKMLSAYDVCFMYSNALQTFLIMEANTMNHDQTEVLFSY